MYASVWCRDLTRPVHLFKLPLLWFSKEHPSTVFLPFASGPNHHLREESDHRRLTAMSNTSSTLAVPPGFDGLLRKWPRRFVSPYIRPWGSNRFQPNLPSSASLRREVPWVFPWFAYRTLRSFPLPGSRTVSPQPLPPRRFVCPLSPEAPRSATRLCSTVKSVSHGDVAISIGFGAPLGFVPLQGSPLKHRCPVEVLRSRPAKAEPPWAGPANAGSP